MLRTIAVAALLATVPVAGFAQTDAPTSAAQRVRLLCGSLLPQTSHGQPIDGTPTLVPVPSRMNCPRISVVNTSRGTAKAVSWFSSSAKAV